MGGAGGAPSKLNTTLSPSFVGRLRGLWLDVSLAVASLTAPAAGGCFPLFVFHSLYFFFLCPALLPTQTVHRRPPHPPLTRNESFPRSELTQPSARITPPHPPTPPPSSLHLLTCTPTHASLLLPPLRRVHGWAAAVNTPSLLCSLCFRRRRRSQRKHEAAALFLPPPPRPSFYFEPLSAAFNRRQQHGRGPNGDPVFAESINKAGNGS